MDELRTWYVVPLDDGWLVKERTVGRGELFPNKAAAIARAEELCLDDPPARYLIRRSDGSIETEVRPVRAPRIIPVGEIELSRSPR
jgi:hypothetical protein